MRSMRLSDPMVPASGPAPRVADRVVASSFRLCLAMISEIWRLNSTERTSGSPGNSTFPKWAMPVAMVCSAPARALRSASRRWSRRAIESDSMLVLPT
jgi:hypothetical protein